jgi:hypothetical protein
VPVALSVVKDPAAGVDAPIVVPFTVPPAIDTVGIVVVPVNVGLALGAYVDAAEEVVKKPLPPN